MKILSLNGGGSLGYITVSLLEKLEASTGVACHENFDLFSGVSTGSIIGYALACKVPAKEIKENYKLFIPKIFNKKTGFFMSFFKSLYKTESIETVLRDYFGDKKINEADVPFMNYACRLNKPATKPEFWKSWKESGNIEAYKAITACCCAPLYFEPYKIGDEYFIDGGIVSNSANTASIVEALKMGVELKDVKMLNMGFYTYTEFKKSDLVGLIKVASNSTKMSIGGSEFMEAHEAEKLLSQSNYIGCFPECFSLALDSQDFDKMDQIVDEFWFNRSMALKWLFS